MAPATIADLAGEEDASSAAARAALEANLGLDQPLPVRYVLWLKELLTGDLGLSYRTGQPVLGMIAQRVGPSLILTGTGVAAAVVIGIPLGVMAAWKPRSLWSRLAGGLTLLSFSAPGFFLCVLAIFFFSVVLGWLPAAGMYSAAGGGGLGDLLRHLVLPASVVCLSSLGNLVRQTASACGEVLGEDYIPHRPGQGSARVGGGSGSMASARHCCRWSPPSSTISPISSGAPWWWSGSSAGRGWAACCLPRSPAGTTP